MMLGDLTENTISTTSCTALEVKDEVLCAYRTAHN
jgi:hypothetical protein